MAAESFGLGRNDWNYRCSAEGIKVADWLEEFSHWLIGTAELI